MAVNVFVYNTFGPGDVENTVVFFLSHLDSILRIAPLSNWSIVVQISISISISNYLKGVDPLYVQFVDVQNDVQDDESNGSILQILNVVSVIEHLLLILGFFVFFTDWQTTRGGSFPVDCLIDHELTRRAILPV